MTAEPLETVEVETITALLVRDLAPIGSVSYERRLNGFALFEDGVMFGFVEADGTAYLRATSATAEQFHRRGGHKHPEMPYWSVPNSVAGDIGILCDLAYQAADNAHLAASFGIDDVAPEPEARPFSGVTGMMRLALLAA